MVLCQGDRKTRTGGAKTPAAEIEIQIEREQPRILVAQDKFGGIGWAGVNVFQLGGGERAGGCCVDKAVARSSAGGQRVVEVIVAAEGQPVASQEIGRGGARL